MLPITVSFGQERLLLSDALNNEGKSLSTVAKKFTPGTRNIEATSMMSLRQSILILVVNIHNVPHVMNESEMMDLSFCNAGIGSELEGEYDRFVLEGRPVD